MRREKEKGRGWIGENKDEEQGSRARTYRTGCSRIGDARRGRARSVSRVHECVIIRNTDTRKGPGSG